MGIGDALMSALAGRSWRVASQAAAQRLEPLDLPATVQLTSSEVVLRPMVAGDRVAMLAFANALPPHDLLFLRRDITQPDVVDEWVRDVEQGRYVTILALLGDEVVGYATVASEGLSWTRHVAELRILVSPALVCQKPLRRGPQTGEQARAARAADGDLAVGAVENHALGGQPVDVGRDDLAVAVAP